MEVPLWCDVLSLVVTLRPLELLLNRSGAWMDSDLHCIPALYQYILFHPCPKLPHLLPHVILCLRLHLRQSHPHPRPTAPSCPSTMPAR